MWNGRKNIKILLLGDQGVGKTSIVRKYTSRVFSGLYVATIGLDFTTKDVERDGQIVRLQFWDTAGQKRFHTLTKSYYKNASGVLLVYDVTQKDSFKNVPKWIDKINERCAENTVKMLVGNKMDLHPSKRMVQHIDGYQMADDWEFQFMEVSAKIGNSVEQCFSEMVDRILDKERGTNLPTNPEQVKKERYEDKKNNKKTFDCGSCCCKNCKCTIS